MTAVPKPQSPAGAWELAADYDDVVRRYADDNGALPEPWATHAAELAHRLRVHYADESDHWARLATEHREGR